MIGLVGGLALSLPSSQLKPDQIFWAVAINIFLAIWHFGSVYYAQRTEHLRDQPLAARIYTIVLVLGWFALIRIHPGFYATQMSVWSQVFIVLSIPWASGIAVVMFALNFYQQTVDSGEAPDLIAAVFFLGVTLLGIFLGSWISSIIGQSVQRKELIQQLEATQADLARSERAAGIAAECQRLAHEIHDTLAQGFISIIMHLEAAEGSLPADSKSAPHLEQARQTARENLEQARRVVNDLRPEVLESAPVHEALARVAQGWSQQSQVAIEFTSTGVPQPLHPEIEVTLLRAVQEGLANVQKHAQAQRVDVTLSYLGDVVILDIQDNGRGLVNGVDSPNSPTSGGYGLVAMRERLQELGGDLLIESEPGEGTTLAASIPIGVTPAAEQSEELA